MCSQVVIGLILHRWLTSMSPCYPCSSGLELVTAFHLATGEFSKVILDLMRPSGDGVHGLGGSMVIGVCGLRL